MPISPNELANKIAALRAPYRAWVQAEALASLTAAMAGYGHDDFDHTRFFFLVHRLKGSGATYGFNTISLKAAVLHDALSESEHDPATLHAMIGALRQACEEAIHS